MQIEGTGAPVVVLDYEDGKGTARRFLNMNKPEQRRRVHLGETERGLEMAPIWIHEKRYNLSWQTFDWDQSLEFNCEGVELSGDKVRLLAVSMRVAALRERFGWRSAKAPGVQPAVWIPSVHGKMFMAMWILAFASDTTAWGRLEQYYRNSRDFRGRQDDLHLFKQFAEKAPRKSHSISASVERTPSGASQSGSHINPQEVDSEEEKERRVDADYRPEEEEADTDVDEDAGRPLYDDLQDKKYKWAPPVPVDRMLHPPAAYCSRTLNEDEVNQIMKLLKEKTYSSPPALLMVR